VNKLLLCAAIAVLVFLVAGLAIGVLARAAMFLYMVRHSGYAWWVQILAVAAVFGGFAYLWKRSPDEWRWPW